MKRHIFKYVGGSRDGWSLDTHSPNEQEKQAAHSAYLLTNEGKKGHGYRTTTEATRLSLTDVATAEEYYVTAREETDDLVSVTVTYRRTKTGKKKS